MTAKEVGLYRRRVENPHKVKDQQMADQYRWEAVLKCQLFSIYILKSKAPVSFKRKQVINKFETFKFLFQKKGKKKSREFEEEGQEDQDSTQMEDIQRGGPSQGEGGESSQGQRSADGRQVQNNQVRSHN